MKKAKSSKAPEKPKSLPSKLSSYPQQELKKGKSGSGFSNASLWVGIVFDPSGLWPYFIPMLLMLIEVLNMACDQRGKREWERVCVTMYGIIIIHAYVLLSIKLWSFLVHHQ